MRHVPTALFIDTEVHKRNGLRFDTKEFSLLTSTFVKGGIRLLLPAVMERELRRHFQRQSEKCGELWRQLHNQHPMKLLKSSVARNAEDVAAECLTELNGQWEAFKDHFTVEHLPAVGDLDAVLNQYFAITAPFSAAKPKEFPDAFVLSALAEYHKLHKVNIAVVSADGDFKTACALMPYVRHFSSIEDYVSAFKPQLTPQQHAVEEPVDPLRPIVTEDLTELKGILRRGAQATTIEQDRLVSLLQNRGENYQYFFLNATDAFWLSRLEAAGFFVALPEPEQMPDGTTKIPDWPPIYYLERVFDSDPENVVRILESLPDTTNPRILGGVTSIAAKCDRPDLLSRLAPKVLASAENPRWDREQFISLLKKLAQW